VLRVLTANLLAGWASAEAVVGLVRRPDADVLFLQELTNLAVTRLGKAGLTDLLPHQRTDVGRGRPGSGIYARFPLTGGLRLRPVSVVQPTARLELPGGRCAELVCVHPHAPNGRPWRRRVARWREELAAALGSGLVPTWGPRGRPAILTLDHVLVDPRCAVLAASVHHLAGSDHRAVYAEFRLPS